MEIPETQQKILNSAKRWFLEKGFKSAPLRKIVNDVGFTLGAFYGYYKNKEELFYALTDETAQGLATIVRSIGEDMQKLPPEQMLYSMLDCYLRRLPELADYLCAHREEMEMCIRDRSQIYAGLCKTGRELRRQRNPDHQSGGDRACFPGGYEE